MAYTNARYETPDDQAGQFNVPTHDSPTPSAPRGGFNYGWDMSRVGEGDAQHPKYWLAEYLQGGVDPNSDWSKGAYDYLVGRGVDAGDLRADQGRLSFGDEFVDTTKQAGEFFWGSNPGSHANYNNGGPGGGGSPAMNTAPMPMILPNGFVPPGMPYNPAANSELMNLQNSTMSRLLSSGGSMDPGTVARMNEQQKEMILARGSESHRRTAQDAARRGVAPGGTAAASQRRVRDSITDQLLQSNRDIGVQAAQTNFNDQLNALSGTESVLGGRENRALDSQRLAEMIRQYNQDFGQRQHEFGANDAWRYNSLNADLEQRFIDSILRGGR